jgi:hypothetical protein
MADAALERSHLNRLEARNLMATWIKSDRRFDGLDAGKLARRVDEARSNGSRVDLTDPRLQGGEARPLERDLSW